MIDLEALEAQMRAINTQIEELKKQSVESSKKVFNFAVAEFFRKVPEVAAVVWKQYTPYFNDGDACEFSVHPACFLSKEDFEKIEEIDLYDYNSWSQPSKWVYEQVAIGDNKYGHLERYKEQIAKYEAMEKELGERLFQIQAGIKKFDKLFSEISSDTLLTMFGDHVQITLTPNEIIVDEYDHE